MLNINIVLLEPRMPGNVGTIGRLAYATGAKLHLIRPYGFGEITQKEVKRAGLDYWEHLEVFEYEKIEDCYSKNPPSSRHFFATTKTQKFYFDIKFKDNDYIFFGREDAGLPEELLENNKETCIIELKYLLEDYEDAKNITEHFPFRLIANSKYIRGIDLLE